MKSTLVIFVFLLFNFSGFTQQFINVLDGFTLEPIDTFDIQIISGKTEVKRMSASTILVSDYKNQTTILISNPQYLSTEVELSKKDKSTLFVVLKPKEKLRSVYQSKYPYYSKPVNEEHDKLLLFDTVGLKLAEYPAGSIALKKYISTNINYPQEAVDFSVEGKVFIQFVVDIDGSITNIYVVRGVNQLMDAECVRLLKKMPNWKPATLRGVKVKSTYNLPISFKLN